LHTSSNRPTAASSGCEEDAGTRMQRLSLDIMQRICGPRGQKATTMPGIAVGAFLDYLQFWSFDSASPVGAAPRSCTSPHPFGVGGTEKHCVRWGWQ